MGKRLLIFFFIVNCFSVGRSQSDSALYYSYIDSLKSKYFIKTFSGHNTQLFNQLYGLSRANFLLNKNELSPCISAIENNKLLHSNSFWIRNKANNIISRAYMLLNESDSCEKYCIRVFLDTYSSIDSKVFAINVIFEKYIRMGNRQEGLKILSKAHDLATLNNSGELGTTYLLEYFLASEEGNFELSLQFLNLSIQYSEIQHNPVAKLKALNNIGVHWYDQNKLDSANKYFYQVKGMAESFNLPNNYVGAVLNLANILLDKDSVETAKRWLIEIDKANYSLDRRIKASLYFTLAEIAILEKNLSEGRYYFNKYFNTVESKTDLQTIISTAELEAGLSYIEGNFRSAYNNELKQINYTDSLSNITSKQSLYRYKKKIQELKKENLIMQHDLQLNLLSEENRFINREFIYLQFGSLILLILIVNLGIIYSTHRKSKIKRLYASEFIRINEQERYRIAEEINNNVGKKLSELIKGNLPERNESLKKDLKDIHDVSLDISTILYPPSLVSSGLLQSIKDLLAGVESKTEIKCKYKTEFFTENMLSQEEKLSVYRIVQECISNSLRHADAEEISITLKRKNLGFQLTYKDKSKHKVSKRLNPGFGLNTMKIRSESIGAKLHYFLQQEGFELGLFIPQQSKNKNHEQ